MVHSVFTLKKSQITAENNLFFVKFILSIFAGGYIMNDKISDLIYAARALADSLSDRHDILDQEEELKDLVEELEACLDDLADTGSD